MALPQFVGPLPLDLINVNILRLLLYTLRVLVETHKLLITVDNIKLGIGTG